MMMMIIISINLRSEKNVAFKGEVRQIFLLAQSFYRPQTKRSLNGQFSPKSPKLPQYRVRVSKINKIRTKCHPTCCGNPLIPSSELLWESMAVFQIQVQSQDFFSSTPFLLNPMFLLVFKMISQGRPSASQDIFE